jgi:transcriptional regulator with XRE-family HTH domain
MPKDYFAARLRELREGAGLTQKQLADKAGLDSRNISRLENGERSPTWDTVRALAATLGVDCRAFEQAPAARFRKRRPGRPPRGQ